jgi:hypothetical protein
MIRKLAVEFLGTAIRCSRRGVATLMPLLAGCQRRGGGGGHRPGVRLTLLALVYMIGPDIRQPRQPCRHRRRLATGRISLTEAVGY